MKLETETFYFRGGGVFNNIQLISSGDKLSSIVVTNGFNSIEGYPSETMISLLDSVPYSNINMKELEKFHEALGKFIKKQPAVKKDSVRNKIKTRHSYVKTLAEYLSMVELCVVEFEDNTAAYIGEYIELLSGSDCWMSDEILISEGMEYDVNSLAIGKKIMDYFKSVQDKIPRKCYFISDAVLLSSIKKKLANK